MSDSRALDAIGAINGRLHARTVLDLLGCHSGDATEVAGLLVTGCPFHPNQDGLSLEVDVVRNRFRCDAAGCPGAIGGTLLELAAWSRGSDLASTAVSLAEELGLTLDPAEEDLLAKALVEEAERAFSAGEISNAEAAARRSLNFRPDSSAARAILGEILVHRGDLQAACDELLSAADSLVSEGNLDRAEEILRRAERLRPDLEDIPLARVRIAELQNRPEKAAKLLERVAESRERAGRGSDNLGLLRRLSELRPGDPDLRLRLAALHEARRDMRTAIREVEKAAELLTAQGRGAEALPLIERVLQIEPQRTRMRLALVERLVESGNVDLARQHLFEAVAHQIEQSEYIAAAQSVRRWLEVEVGSLEAREWLSRIYQEQEMPAEAAGELRQASQLCRAQGDSSRALEFLYRAKFVQPDDVALREELVAILRERNEGPRTVLELLDLAELHYTTNHSTDALHALERAVEADSAASSRISVAEAYRTHSQEELARRLLEESAGELEQSGDLEGAIACWSSIADAEPADLASRESLLTLLWQSGQMAAATTAAAELAGLFAEEAREEDALALVEDTSSRLSALAEDHLQPLRGDAILRLMEVCAELGVPERGVELYQSAIRILRLAPAEAVRCAESALMLREDFEPALVELAETAVLAEDPQKSAAALTRLAQRAIDQKRVPEATELLARAARLSPRGSPQLKQRAELLDKGASAEQARQAWHEYLAAVRAEESPAEALAEHESYLARNAEDLQVRRAAAELQLQLARAADAEETYNRLLQDAESSGNVVEAVAAREGLLALQPDDTLRRVALAGALLAAGVTDRAVQELTTAAGEFLAQSNWDRARLACTQALQLQPDSPGPLTHLAELERRLGRTEALAEVLMRLGPALEHAGDFSGAAAALRERVTVEPGAASARRALAELLDRAGDPSATSIWLEAARLHAEAKEYEAALSIYAGQREWISSDIEALGRWASAAEAAGSREGAIQSAVLLAEAHLAQGAFPEAGRILKRAKNLWSASSELAVVITRLAEAYHGEEAVEAWLEAADMYSAAGEMEPAGECLNRAVDADPENPTALARLAAFYEQQGDLERAFRVLLALLRTRLGSNDPSWRSDLAAVRTRAEGDSAWRLAIARVLLIAGQRGEAAADLEIVAREAATSGDYAGVLDACDADPRVAVHSAILRDAKAEALLKAGRQAAAAAWLRECAESALHEGRPDEAEAYTRKWSALSPADPDALGIMADIHLQRRNPQLAYETSLAQGNFLWARGDFEAAMTALRRAVDANPDGLDARRFLWQIELDAGRKSEALADMTTLVHLHLQRGEERNAYEVLRQILRVEPRSVDALRLMAQLIYRHRGFPKALPAYRRLVAALRDDGRVEEALQEYELVLEVEDAPVELRLEYADYLELLGRHSAAKRHYLTAARHVRDVLGDYGYASRLLTQASAEPWDPEDAEALEELGILRRIARMAGQAAQAFRDAAHLHELRGYPERALDCLQQSLELVPGFTRPADLSDMARLLLATGRRGEAADVCRKAIAAAMESDEPASTDQLLQYRLQLYDLDPGDAENGVALVQLLPAEEVVSRSLELARGFFDAGQFSVQIQIINVALARAPESLELRGEALMLLRRQGAGEAIRTALADLCRTAAASGHADVARAALEQLDAMPPTPGSALTCAPLFLLCGDTTRAMHAYQAGVQDCLAVGDCAGAIGALEAALALGSAAVPCCLVAAVLQQSGEEASVRSLAIRVLDDALVRRARARAAVVGSALLKTLTPGEASLLLRHMVERGGAALAALVTGVHCDWLLARNEFLNAGSLVRHLTEVAPDSPEVWKLAAQVLAGISQPEAAAAAQEKALQLALTEQVPPDEGELEEEEEFGEEESVLESVASFLVREHRVAHAVVAMKKLSALAQSRQDPVRAAYWLQQALTLLPSDAGLREQLAERLLEANSPEEAASQFRELAQQRLRRDDTAGARTAAEHVLELDPRDLRTAEFLLQLAIGSNDAEAIVRQTAAVARAHIASGAADAAYQLLMDTLEHHPNHPELLRALAACTKDVTSAGIRSELPREELARGTTKAPLNSSIAQFELLLSLQPDDLDVLEILANTCAAEGLSDKHAKYAEELVLKCAAAGDLDRAAEAAELALSRAPELAAVRRALGDALASADRAGAAVTEWLSAAEAYAGQENFQEAAECTRRVVEAEPDNLRAWRLHSEYLSGAGRTEDARDALEKITGFFRTPSEIRSADTTIRRLKGLDTNDPVAHERAYALERRAGRKGSAMEELVWLVRYHLAQGNLAAAEKMMDEGRELDPDNLTLLECLVDLERQRENPDALRSALLAVVKRAGQLGQRERAHAALETFRKNVKELNTTTRMQLAEMLISTGDRIEGLNELVEVVKDDLRTGDPAAARATAESILRRHPGIPELYAAMAEPFVAAGRSDIASGYLTSAATLAASVGDAVAREQYLKEALVVRPRWAEGMLQLAESYVVNGDRESAMQMFSRLENLYLEDEQYAKAADAVRRQVALQPKDMSLRERLAELYELGGDKARASESLEEVAAFRQKRGDLKGAIQAYRKLLNLRPRDPAVLQRFAEMLDRVGGGAEVVEAYMKLAEAYLNRGANVQAAEIYARVVGLEPSHEEARERLMKLQK